MNLQLEELSSRFAYLASRERNDIRFAEQVVDQVGVSHDWFTLPHKLVSFNTIVSSQIVRATTEYSPSRRRLPWGC